MPRSKKVYWTIRVLALGLGLFFVYAGGKKLFLPPAPRTGGPSTVPPEFIELIKALKSTGFYMEMVGWFQFIAGGLMLARPTVLIGALMLIPVTFNIFVIHIGLDNRVGEFVFTGALFLANAVVVFYHRDHLIVRKSQLPS